MGAKGKKCHNLDVKKVEFIEPLHKPEDDIKPEEEEGPHDVIDLGTDLGTDIPVGVEIDLNDLPEITIEEPTLF